MLNVKNRGAIALPVTVGILLIVLVVGVTLAGIGFSELFVTKTAGEAKEGLYLAEFGIQDALLKITRNQTFATSTPATYNPTSSVLVTITPNPASDNESTKCEEETGQQCTCNNPPQDYDTQEECENHSCVWDGGCKPETTQFICSEATITGGGGSQKTITLQVVADVDSKGKVTECGWEQI